MRAVALATIGAVLLVVAAALGPAAIAGNKPKTGDERVATSRAWRPSALRNLVDGCLSALVRCGATEKTAQGAATRGSSHS